MFLNALERKHLPYMTTFNCVNRIVEKFFKFIFLKIISSVCNYLTLMSWSQHCHNIFFNQHQIFGFCPAMFILLVSANWIGQVDNIEAYLNK